MLITEEDLAIIKQISSDKELPMELTILSETHIDKEFWQIEVLSDDMFQIYHIGKYAGYREGVEAGKEMSKPIEECLNKCIKNGDRLANLVKKLMEKIKQFENAS